MCGLFAAVPIAGVVSGQPRSQTNDQHAKEPKAIGQGLNKETQGRVDKATSAHTKAHAPTARNEPPLSRPVSVQDLIVRWQLVHRQHITSGPVGT